MGIFDGMRFEVDGDGDVCLDDKDGVMVGWIEGLKCRLKGAEHELARILNLGLAADAGEVHENAPEPLVPCLVVKFRNGKPTALPLTGITAIAPHDNGVAVEFADHNKVDYGDSTCDLADLKRQVKHDCPRTARRPDDADG